MDPAGKIATTTGVTLTYDNAIDAWVISVGASPSKERGGAVVGPARKREVKTTVRGMRMLFPCCSPENLPRRRNAASDTLACQASSQRDREEKIREAVVYCKMTNIS